MDLKASLDPAVMHCFFDNVLRTSTRSSWETYNKKTCKMKKICFHKIKAHKGELHTVEKNLTFYDITW